MAEKPRLLIVEDEEAIRKGLIDLFVFHGYAVETASDGNEGLRRALHEKFDGIILDLMLPGLDGFSICNAIRQRDRDQPIIMLTAKNSDDDIITGLTLGADDYISKPFSVRELVLRVEAVLRRSRRTVDQTKKLKIGEIEIDADNLTGRNGAGAEIPFSRREVSLLQHLALNSHRPVSRGELLVEVWGYSRGSEIDTRTVDIHIAKLRKKIERDPSNPRFLVTLRGEGYKLLCEHEE